MKTTSDGPPKPQKKRRSVGMRKKSTAAYSAYIYRIEKFSATDTVSVMRLLPDAHAQVGSEAARLSKFNRKRVVTQRELHAAAVRVLQDKRG